MPLSLHSPAILGAPPWQRTPAGANGAQGDGLTSRWGKHGFFMVFHDVYGDATIIYRGLTWFNHQYGDTSGCIPNKCWVMMSSGVILPFILIGGKKIIQERGILINQPV